MKKKSPFVNGICDKIMKDFLFGVHIEASSYVAVYCILFCWKLHFVFAMCFISIGYTEKRLEGKYKFNVKNKNKKKPILQACHELEAHL